MIKSKNNLDIENYKIRINEINKTLYELEKENNKKLFSKYRKIEKLERLILTNLFLKYILESIMKKENKEN